MSLAPTVVVLGWLGARERQLRTIANFYSSRGAQVIARAPANARAMATVDGWDRVMRDVVAEVVRVDTAEPRPLWVHAFSNAGFWAARAMFRALDRDHPDLAGRHVGTVLDSAPGFPEYPSWKLSVKYGSRALLPGVLGAIGLRPAHRHLFVGPPVVLGMMLWHVLAPGAVRSMWESFDAMATHHAGKRLLLIYGGADELVPAKYVDRFGARAERVGAHVERLYFPEGTHVRHTVEHRREVFDAIATMLDSTRV